MTTGFGRVDFRTNASDVTMVNRNTSFSSTGSGPGHPMSQSEITEMVSIGRVQFFASPLRLPMENLCG